MANLQNTVTGLLFTFSAGLFVRIMYYKQQFGIFTVTFLLNQITTHKKASLKNIVTRLIIIFCATPIVLIIRTKLWSSYREIVT